MNLKILSLTIIIFNVYNGLCLGVESYLNGKDENINLRVENSNPQNRKLILGFLGSIFKPVIRGIADVISPPPPPPPPPPPQIIYQPHPQAAPTAPTAKVEPEKKEESKPAKEDEKKKKKRAKSDKKDKKDSDEEDVDNGFDQNEDDDDEDDDEDD